MRTLSARAREHHRHARAEHDARAVGKPLPAAHDLGRFAVNSTVGVVGFVDVASRIGIQENREDFGQTLGRWGIPSGPYLMLPFLGPSTLRDAPALYADYLTDGRQYIADNDLDFAFAGLSFVDRRARLIPAEAAIEGASTRTP